MADSRSRKGKRRAGHQVRFKSKKNKSGYAWKTFKTAKEAKAFIESGAARAEGNSSPRDALSVEQAIDRWLDICEKEGRGEREPVAERTLDNYRWRARAMKAYGWEHSLHELQEHDIVEFRSWLKRTYTRDKAQKVLSSFHSVMLEMKRRKIIASDPAEEVTIKAQSRYDNPVEIPTVEELQNILRTADLLANSKNQDVADAWERYRPMIYLAADSGMRPQEYLALPPASLMPKGVNVVQALDGNNEIGPPKTKASRRYISVGAEALGMAKHYAKKHGTEDLVFPTRNGHGAQQYRHYMRSGWYILMEKAGFVEEEKRDGKTVLSRKFTPYALRHFFASMLIHQNKDAKYIQTALGHEDISMTFSVYGHLIRRKQTERDEDEGGVLRYLQ